MTDTNRWMPHRVGIANVWEYDDQTFAFADGRLILRGPNGSGKSNALALLFPFLIDGTMSAAAMDPFAGGRSMKSLLLGVLRDDAHGRRFRHDQRLGYVWMELRRARPDEPDGHDHVTIGCGARANAGGDARSWFFVTDRRVGVDLDLVPAGEPMTRGKLAEALGEGTVFETAEAYRHAVDRALFDLGADRLAKLTALIRVLRRPQLAGKLDLDLLSDVLSSGLPAVDPTAIEDLASSLDHLEVTQRELADLRTALATVEAFLPIYRTYLAGEARLRAERVLEADASLRRSRRDAEVAASEVARVTGELAANSEARWANAIAAEETDARRQAHLESAAFQDAASLREVEGSARRAGETAVAAAKRRDQAGGAAASADQRAGSSQDRATETAGAAARLLTETTDAADAIEAVWTLAADQAIDPTQLATAVSVAERSRREDLATVRRVVGERDDARRDHERAESAVSAALEAADERDQAAVAADETVGDERAALAGAVRTWAVTAPGLDADGIESLAAAAATAGESGEPTLSDRYRDLTGGWRDGLVSTQARTVDHLGVLADQVTEVSTERGRVAAAVDPGPEPPRWRHAERAGRPGAPLWACCDFAESARDDSDRAGVEAGLDAAGLLDAWISPDAGARSAASPTSDHEWGQPDRINDTDRPPSDQPATADRDVSRFDAWLIPVGQEAAASHATLADVLLPTVPEGSGLAAETIANVLASIDLGRVGIAVSADGVFSLGPLHGQATKVAPEFIGATARAERRRRRLAELDEQLAELADEVAAAEQRREEVAATIGALDASSAAVPSTDDVERALVAASRAGAAAELAREAAERLAAAEAAAASALAYAAAVVIETARRHRLEPSTEQLDRVERGLVAFASVGRQAVETRRRAADAAARADEDRALAEAAAADLAGRESELVDADREAAGLRARAEELRLILGADAEAPLRQLEALEAGLRELRAQVDVLGEARSRLDLALGKARSQVDELDAAIDRHAARLSEVAACLTVFRRRDLLAVVTASEPDGSDVSGSNPDGRDVGGPGPVDQHANDADDAADNLADESIPTEAVGFAGWLADRIGGPVPSAEDHSRAVAAVDRAQRPLVDELRHGYAASIAHDDDVMTVEVTSDTGTFGLSVLADRLRRQEADLRTYLTEGDREVFERFLLNRVAHELRHLLGDADEFVGGVNASLGRTRTASGLQVELAWELAADDGGVREAVRLLRHDTTQMGDDDRAALRAFFDGAIRQQRAERPEAGYKEALEAALDYRAWHVFQPHLRTAEGTRARLTRARFRELSGGEQAVALHLPLFAAAAAHYDRASADAPRLVALDEAFAGIDETMRGELMALTVAFDLDVILTGHELWGAYAEVPAIAVHDLLRRPPAEGVSVFSLRWDGANLVEDDPEDGGGIGPEGGGARSTP